MAQGEVILVAGGFASLSSGAQQVNGPPVFAPEVVEPRYVVIRLPDQYLHAMLPGESLSFLICGEGSLKVI